MKNVFRWLLFGAFVGLLAGWLLAQEQQRREDEARSEAIANDPEIKLHMAQSRFMRSLMGYINNPAGDET
jgi:hypothetical protein